MSIKSKYIGTEVNGLEVIDSFYRLNDTLKSGNTYYKLLCKSCGRTIERPRVSVSKGFAKCPCQNKSAPRNKTEYVRQNLIDFRLETGLDEECFAKPIGYTEEYQKRIEAGSGIITVDYLEKLEEIYQPADTWELVKKIEIERER